MKNLCLVLVTVIVCVSGLVKADITSNLVAHWEFDEGFGNTAYNSVSNKHGTLVGDPSWTDGVFGSALKFDGSGDYVIADGYHGITGKTSRTFAAWIKADTAEIYQAEAVVSWGRYNVDGGYWKLVLERDNFRGTPGAMHLEVEGGWKVGDTNLADDSWHHIAVVLENDGNPNASEIKLYVDGVEEIYSAVNSGAIYTSFFENVRIGSGAWNYKPAAFFNGKIDDVRIYDRALTELEIQELYNAADRELVSIEISGPNQIAENSQTQYQVIAYYDDGSSEDVTNFADLSVEPADYAAISGSGLLTSQQLLDFEQLVTLRAEYSKGETAADAELVIIITTDCSALEIVERNITSALILKEEIVLDIEVAIENESFSQQVLRQMMRNRDFGDLKRIDIIKARRNVIKAIIDENQSKQKIYDSIEKLETSMENLEGNTVPGQGAPGQQ